MASGLSDSVRILHVDDDPDLVEITATFIERFDDLSDVDTATSASDGLDRLEQTEYDCVVSDYDMPGKDGIEFLHVVREDYPDLPFILYTGKGSEEVASRAISAGVTDYLQKGSGTSQYEVLANRIGNVVSQYHTRRELERSQDLLEHTEQLADVGGWEADAETGEQRWTGGTYEIHDIDPDAEFDPTVDAGVGFYHPADQEVIARCVERCMEYGEPYDVELRLQTAEDRLRWVRATGEAIREDGEVITIRGAIQDITKRKELERDRLETTRQFQAVLNTVEAAIFIKDTDGRYQLMNPECRKLLGIDPDEEITGRTDHEFLPDDVAAQYQRDDQRVLEREETIEVEEEVPTPEGTQHNLTLKSPFYDGSGELQGICAVSTDISEVEIQRERLHRQNERFDELASTISHDLQTPLSTARGRAELAIETGDTEQMQTALDAIERTDELRKNLVEVLRTKEIVSETEPVEIEQTGRDIWETVSTQDAASLQIRDAVSVVADPDALRRLFENLFSNAIEHGNEDVAIRIGTTDGGFFIEDDGPGIPEDERDEVFTPGYSTKRTGSGVGLASVREIVMAMDWEIRVTEGSEGGARFEITGVNIVDE
jgi:PAS domain S-box-containing protein